MNLDVRAILSIEWPDTADGRYYWQHCARLDSDDFPNDAQMILAVTGDFQIAYTSQVQVNQIRWYLPGTEILYLQNGASHTRLGFLAPQENVNILVAARWRMWGADGSYTYHLHRQPMGEDYIQNGQYTPGGHFQQLARMSTFIGQGVYRTKTWSLITDGELGGTPVQWQLRHGTKRRNRRFGIPS